VIPAVTAILVPTVAALLGLTAGRDGRRAAAFVAVGAALVTFAVTLGTVLAHILGAGVATSASYGVVPTGSVDIHVALRLDGLAATVAFVVAAVALAVQVYSVAYLHDDPRYPSYAAFVSLFTAAMLLVVHADDLIVLLVGWEVMGVCSYFLISHHWERRDARAGGVKAFLVTRLGDVAFLFGIFTIGLAAGTFRIQDIELIAGAEPLSGATLTVGTMLLLGGVVGKSAQFPLHVWLPDAMAGPTPVSALIHAATMVAAGIFVVARLYDLFLAAPATLAVMAVIAAVTMLGAALAALAQDDIKRVLAYSTVSQLAYMLGALAVGSYAAASFHLITHGAFKALLFLAAGAVIHAVGSNSMTRMGGLRRALPVTFVTMTIGLLALAGVPPLSGFFSKEAVLASAEEAALHEGPVAHWAGWLVLVVGLLTVGVTAAYAVRLWLLTFFGRGAAQEVATSTPARSRGGSHVARRAVVTRELHDPPAPMRWPLIALAVPSAVLGIVGLSTAWLPSWLSRSVFLDPVTLGPLGAEPEALTPTLVTSVLSTLLVVLGGAAGFLGWRAAAGGRPVRERPLLVDGFYLDDVYELLVVRPVGRFASLASTVDTTIIARAVSGSGNAAQQLGATVRRLQDGDVQRYLSVLLAGSVLVAVAAWTTVAR